MSLDGPQSLQMKAAVATAASLQRHEGLVKVANKWVAQSFYGTLLKQMRNSPFKSDLFSGGRGGEAFSSLYDQQLVERMSKAAPHGLARGIVRRIEGAETYRQNEKSLKMLREARQKELRRSEGQGKSAAGSFGAT
jgi:Rod binding domain-containing protein